MIYGHTRVLTDGQSVDAQVRQLKAAGARQVLREVAGGAKTERGQPGKALAQLEAGDVLMVTRLDRPSPFNPRHVYEAGGRSIEIPFAMQLTRLLNL